MKSGSRIPWSPKLEDNPVVVRTGIVVHMDQTKIPIRKLFQDLANDLVIVIDLDPAAVGADNQVLELFFFIRDGRRGELVDPGALIVSWEMRLDHRYSPLMDIAPENDDLPEIVALIHHLEE